MVDDDYGGDGGIEDDPGAGSSVSGDVASDPGPSPDESESFEPDLSRSDWSPGDLTFEGMDVAPGPGGFSPGGAEGYWGGDGEPGPDWSPAETDPFSTNLGGIGSLTGDSPDLATILTAPLEALISFFTFGLVDPEFTGKDVFSLPGASSSDFSRAMAGKQGPQPVGVEVGLPMIGGFEFNPGSGIKGTGIFGGDKGADFTKAASDKVTITPTPAVLNAAAAKVDTARAIAQGRQDGARTPSNTSGTVVGPGESLASGYQQMDTRHTPTPQANVDAFNRSNALFGSPQDQGYGRPAPAPPAEVSFAGRSRGPGGVMPGSGTVDPGLQAALDANANRAVMEKMAMQQPPAYRDMSAPYDPMADARARQDAQARENAYLAGGDPYYGYSGPPLGGAFSPSSTAGKVASGYQQAQRDASPDVSVMIANAIRNSLANSPTKASERLNPSSSSFGVTSPHTTVQAAALDPQIQAAKKALGSDFDLLREYWSNIQKIGKAGGGAVRGPVTGGQRSRGIMSLR